MLRNSITTVRRLLPPPGHRVRFAKIIGLSVVSATLAGVGNPIFTYFLIDSIVRRQFTWFLGAAVASLLAYSLLRFVNALTDRLVDRLKNLVAAKYTLDLLGVYFRYPYARAVSEGSGYFSSRIVDDAARASEHISLLLQVFSAGLMLLGAWWVCCLLSWKLAAVVAILVPFLQWVTTRAGRDAARSAIEVREADSSLRAIVERAVCAYKAVGMFSLKPLVNDCVSRTIDIRSKKSEERALHAARYQAVSGLMLSHSELLMIVCMGLQVFYGQFSIGSLFGFLSAYSRVVRSFESLVILWPKIKTALIQFDRTQAFLADAENRPCVSTYASIELENVAYSVAGKRILSACTIAIRPGDRVLIVGPNGAGKSTLLHIFCGYLDPSSGTARIPAREVMSAALPAFSFAPGTIADNLGCASMSEQAKSRLAYYLERLGLSLDLNRDPALCSDGEKKKIQIIMTLLKQADFYFFDEPTSNLDTESASRAMDLIMEETRGSALTVVLHGGQSYWERFDRVLRLTDLGGDESTLVLGDLMAVVWKPQHQAEFAERSCPSLVKAGH